MVNVGKIILIVGILFLIYLVTPRGEKVALGPKANYKIKEVVLTKEVLTTVSDWNGMPTIGRGDAAIPLVPSMTLLNGDLITTTGSSNITFAFGYGSKIRVLPESEMLLKISKNDYRFMLRKGSVMINHLTPEQLVKWKTVIELPDAVIPLKERGMVVITYDGEKDELRVATGKGQLDVMVKSLQKNFELNENEGIIIDGKVSNQERGEKGEEIKVAENVGDEERMRPGKFPWVALIPWAKINEDLTLEYEQDVKVDKELIEDTNIDETAAIKDERHSTSTDFVNKIRAIFIGK